jgi:hypothetical protein
MIQKRKTPASDDVRGFLLFANEVDSRVAKNGALAWKRSIYRLINTTSCRRSVDRQRDIYRDFVDKSSPTLLTALQRFYRQHIRSGASYQGPADGKHYGVALGEISSAHKELLDMFNGIVGGGDFLHHKSIHTP